MFSSSQSFDSILLDHSSPIERYLPFGGIFLPPNLCPLRRALSKSESATPTTTSDERLSSPLSSNRSFSTSPTPPIGERIGNWHQNSANETPIWRREETNGGNGKGVDGKRKKLLRFTTDATVEERDAEGGRVKDAAKLCNVLQTATNFSANTWKGVVPQLSMAQKNDDDDVTTTTPTDEKW
ncbi:hypothetical protein GPALN_007991 [Globodera pallida]|nr:hypothetical protein GPALN_007991 [Globodera pallida]